MTMRMTTWGWAEDFTHRTFYIRTVNQCCVCGKKIDRYTGDTQNDICFECLQELSENNAIDASAYKHLEFFRFLRKEFYLRGYSEKQAIRKAFRIAKEVAKLHVFSRS